ncbi:protein KINESIN LIGHT CHAIN-RELATED 2 isoform X2 [Malania oleifera]|uniref:protein KINESIN LIGHT CHAIN-RELATED 2 isoform X2 n=1 Tax=Malania oleifera TaxID=397392 RepID=UPI0025AE7B8F|nr:protein KINESIN LIGHT CHAIN-RELATED 2 isoform X2 [Malania oleifera]
MPGLVMDGSTRDGLANDANGGYTAYKENSTHRNSPRSPLSPRSLQSPRSDSIDLAIDRVVETSIEELYRNVYEMQSSDQSPSRRSFLSYGDESRIDSELRYLVGIDFEEVEITKEVVTENRKQDNDGNLGFEEENGSTNKNSAKIDKTQSVAAVNSKRFGRLQLEPESYAKSSPKAKSSHERPPFGKRYEKKLQKPNVASPMRKHRNFSLGGGKLPAVNPPEAGLDNPDLGPFLLKQTRDLIASGDNPKKALELALRAVKSFEKCANGKPNLELVMCLHVLAAIYCSLGKYNDAIPVLERSIEIPALEEGQDHALAKFAGCMQLGDTYAMIGQIENSILFYTAGMEIQRQVLGEMDPRFGETCRYVAEAHVQALQFDEAQKLCQMALDIHRENGLPASLEEAADRRLMGLICDSKGDYESALEHYVLASMAMAANGHEADVGSIDCCIGDAYLALARFDEAIFAYQKALTMLKSTKGENHPAVASVYVHMADLNNKIGKFREARSYCENALRIYGKPLPGIPIEEIASGLIDISAIYQSMNELDRALKLLQKARKIYSTNAPGQQNTIAGIEALMGVMYYMMGDYSDSYDSFRNAISKLRASAEKKSAFFGVALNQMGLTCVQCYAINEAADLFEEARSILEKEYGPYHSETLAVYSNLAGTYDAMGRLDDAIEILEYIVGIREDKLGTANPDVNDERRRLSELLKDAGRIRNRKFRSLETLLDTNSHPIINDGIQVL